MSVLLETTLGDIVIDLDYQNSPSLCYNFIKLVKVRYYTNCLLYDVVPNRYCITGDPRGDGKGGCSIYGFLDSILTNHNSDSKTNNNNNNNILNHPKRFIKSEGRELTAEELQQKGIVSVIEMNQIKDTIGSQFMITLMDGEGMSLDGALSMEGEHKKRFLSLGKVVEDENDVLYKVNSLYCDKNGRPYTDVRIIRALIVYDPFTKDDPKDMREVLTIRNIDMEDGSTSPNYDKPVEECVEPRISAIDSELLQEYDEDADDADHNKDKKQEEREEKTKNKEAKSRAIVLEMLGDIPTADITPPENVLFICKLNPITQEEDLELIFSRFDNDAKVDIIRDPESGQSLCYAFCEFQTKDACVEAYFKMNNALVDDRRIKVDFSQSVSNIWNRFWHTKKKGGNTNNGGGGVGFNNNGNRRMDHQGGGGNHNTNHSRNITPRPTTTQRSYENDRHRHNDHQRRKRRDYSSGSDDHSSVSSSDTSRDKKKKHKKHHKREKHHRSSSSSRRPHHKHEKSSKRHRR